MSAEVRDASIPLSPPGRGIGSIAVGPSTGQTGPDSRMNEASHNANCQKSHGAAAGVLAFAALLR